MPQKKFIVCLIILFLFEKQIFGQELPCSQIRNDTLWLCCGTKILFDNKLILISTDTIITGNDITKVYFLNDPYARSRVLYDSIKSKAERRDFTKLAYQLLFPESGAVTNKNETYSEASEESEYMLFADKIIQNIIIYIDEPFDETQTHPTRARLSRIGNSLHRSTRKTVLKNNLLFKEGQRLNPYVMAENAQLLRSLPYLSEAYIRPVVDEKDAEKVDVIVWAKDALSLGLDIYLPSSTLFDLSIFDQNFLGYGNRLSSTIRYNSAKAPAITLKNLNYRIENIKGTFFYSEADYTNEFNHESIRLTIARDFLTTQTRFASGLSLTHHEKIQNIFSPYFRQDHLKYFNPSLWIGKAFNIHSQGRPTQLVISSSLESRLYTQRPYVSADSNKIYFNSSNILFNIAISRNAYYKGNYIYQFGRTEDIPYGFLAELTVGPESYEYYNRTYIGFTTGLAKYFSRLGYISGKFLISSYNRNSKFEQGQCGMRLDYFSNLYIYGPFKLRHFATLNYRKGLNRLEGESVNVVKELDLIIAHPSDTAFYSGNEKLTLSYSSTLFTPYYFYGFRLAFFDYVNMAYLGGRQQLKEKNKFFAGFGIGAMVRNESLVIKTLQLKLGFYPELPDNRKGIFIEFSGIMPLNFFNYKPHQPLISKYE